VTRRSFGLEAVALSCAFAALSCGSKGAVVVTAVISSASAQIEQPSSLASLLVGGFTLHVELGQVAPSSTDVSPEGFSLVRPSDQQTLVVLHFTTAPDKPYHLEPGASAEIAATIADQLGTSGQQLTTDEATAICTARTVQIAGSVSDTATGKPTPLSSSSFDVTGCP